MINNILIFDDIFLSILIYFVGVITPGPSNLALMNVAMKSGRKPAMILAFGIVCGSMFWGILAAIGLSAILLHYSYLLVGIKIAGGLYLFWLLWKSAKSVLFKKISPSPFSFEIETKSKLIFLKGLLIHMTNPKAIFVWLSIVSFSISDSIQTTNAIFIVLICGFIGLIVFCGYAILFSTLFFRNLYIRLCHWFEAGMALVFGYAGYRIITMNVVDT